VAHDSPFLSPSSSTIPIIRLLLSDDQPIFRHGLAILLADEADLDVVGQADDGHEAICPVDAPVSSEVCLSREKKVEIGGD
jgi:hypothetical protein